MKLFPRSPKPGTTTIWSIVESMQRKLEHQGMDTATVDQVVTRGIAAILAGRERQRQRRHGSLLAGPAGPFLVEA